MIRKLAEGDEMLNKGENVAEVPRSFAITETTWYQWKNTYGGINATDAKRLKDLETENKRLKTIAADLALDNTMLGEIAAGKV